VPTGKSCPCWSAPELLRFMCEPISCMQIYVWTYGELQCICAIFYAFDKLILLQCICTCIWSCTIMCDLICAILL
jgi:hypothetical protein